MSHTATNVKVSRDEDRWEAEISAEIPSETIAKYREQALKEIQKDAKLDGFRPGKAPIDRILQIYGEGPALRRAAEIAIQEELPEILASEKLPIVEAPRVTTDTPEAGKPLSFKARAALAPEIKLGDYKKIAEKHRNTKEDATVTDKEHAEALTHLRRERARIDKIEAGLEPAKAADESRDMKEEDLPAIDDEFVQSLGYENAEKFGEALRENMGHEKEGRALEKVRAGILDDLVKESKIKYPAALADYELDDMEAHMGADLARIGQTVDSYLAEQKKTREEMRAMWKDAADKRAKVRLILAEIARQEKLEPSSHDIEHELSHAKQHYPNVDDQTLFSHISHAMRNEMVMRFLDGSPEPEPHDHSHDHDHE